MSPRFFVAGQLRSLLDMLQLPIAELMQGVHRISGLSQLATLAADQRHGLSMSEDDYADVNRALSAFIDNCRLTGMDVTANVVFDLLNEWLLADSDDKGRHLLHPLTLRIGHLAGYVGNVIQAEARTKVSMVLSPEKAKLFEPKEPIFGAEARAKFTGAIYDIDEAAKCLALGRSTAAVFHLMRIIEVLLKAIHAHLGLAPPINRNWGEWLRPIKTTYDRRGKAWSEFGFFQDVWERIHAIKDAQRNPTLHVEKTYTEGEADLIFRNTEAFLKKIASKLDEKGEPKALP